MTWCPPLYGTRGQELQWLQGTLQNHDTFCGCKNPILHLIKIGLRHGGVQEFTEDNLKTFVKCHLTTEDTTETDGKEPEDTPGPEGDLDFGDLDKLFEEEDPFTEESTG